MFCVEAQNLQTTLADKLQGKPLRISHRLVNITEQWKREERLEVSTRLSPGGYNCWEYAERVKVPQKFN